MDISGSSLDDDDDVYNCVQKRKQMYHHVQVLFYVEYFYQLMTKVLRVLTFEAGMFVDTMQPSTNIQS